MDSRCLIVIGRQLRSEWACFPLVAERFPGAVVRVSDWCQPFYAVAQVDPTCCCHRPLVVVLAANAEETANHATRVEVDRTGNGRSPPDRCPIGCPAWIQEVRFVGPEGETFRICLEDHGTTRWVLLSVGGHTGSHVYRHIITRRWSERLARTFRPREPTESRVQSGLRSNLQSGLWRRGRHWRSDGNCRRSSW